MKGKGKKEKKRRKEEKEEIGYQGNSPHVMSKSRRLWGLLDRLLALTDRHAACLPAPTETVCKQT